MPRSSVDEHLFGKPRLRAAIEALAADPGCSIASLRKRLRREGLDVSRSAAARWLLKYRRSETGRRSTPLAAVIRRVIELNDLELKALAKSLRPAAAKQ